MCKADNDHQSSFLMRVIVVKKEMRVKSQVL